MERLYDAKPLWPAHSRHLQDDGPATVTVSTTKKEEETKEDEAGKKDDSDSAEKRDDDEDTKKKDDQPSDVSILGHKWSAAWGAG